MERMIVDVYSRSYQDTVVGRYSITSCVYLLLTVDEPSKGEQPIGRKEERSLLLQQAYVCNSKGHDTRLDTNPNGIHHIIHQDTVSTVQFAPQNLKCYGWICRPCCPADILYYAVRKHPQHAGSLFIV